MHKKIMRSLPSRRERTIIIKNEPNYRIATGIPSQTLTSTYVVYVWKVYFHNKGIYQNALINTHHQQSQ